MLASINEECKSNLSLKNKKRIDSKKISTENSNNLVFAHLNLTSTRNEKLLSDRIKGNIDVLMISKTKIDDCFPVGNFSSHFICTDFVYNFNSLYSLDRDLVGGVILLCVREDIPSNLLSIEIKPIEGFYVTTNG